MLERLRYWLFQRRDCKYCCLCCEFYDMCRIEFSGNRRKKKMRYVCGTGKINYHTSGKPGNMNKFLYTRAKGKQGKRGKK